MFDIVALDDLIAEGTQTAVVQAFAAWIHQVIDTVNVLDEETAALDRLKAVPGVVSETDAAGKCRG